MDLESFNYHLPDALIAEGPHEPRDHSRLMVVAPDREGHDHRRFFEIPDYLRAGDCLVLNNTRVLPARLFGTAGEGRRFEVFLLEPGDGPFQWHCLVRPGKKIAHGEPLAFPNGRNATIARQGDGTFSIQFEPFESQAAFFEWLRGAGNLPLPPYIKRPPRGADSVSYQTVYARDPGSVAAPTAGLHFTDALLETLRKKGIETVEVTLHIGYGTFSPIRAERIEEHRMHEERYLISREAYGCLGNARQQGRRVIAVGTTALRALESIPRYGLTGRTDLFIHPGYRFQWVDGLITNFHLPKSSLYVLVASLLGLERTRAAYAAAIEAQYRFYSYGDAMLILPSHSA